MSEDQGRIEMNSKKLIALFALLSIAIRAQSPTTTLSADQVKYFASFFSLMGDPNLKEAFPSHREVSVKSIFGMNETDAAALRLSVSTYTTEMTQILNAERGIISGKTALTDTDRAAVVQLVQMRDQMVQTLAAALLGSLRPQTSAQLLADARRIINIRNGKGSN
jgi:hypothetical protein